MFGEYQLRTQFVKVGDTKIHMLEETEELIKYRRDNVRVILKKSRGGFRIVPAPAEGYGVKLLLIDFEERIMIPPRETLYFYLTAPIEAEVLLGDTVVDRFQISCEKYALYGTPEIGAIARYWRSGVYASEPESPGLIRIMITNKTNKWMEMDHVVVYIAGTVMFYSYYRAYYPLVKVEFKSDVPEVNNTGEPPREGLTPSKKPLPLPNFLMRW
ncbi:DUF432 domain-containing protein [Thermococcus sp.]|uniref:DUF432 domain-containing protein n=1 Tax=Thermococcus sp. TaxID=35749 RepID=UPI002621AD86|nr:DUF432 domain-containing protein [Thermococcus sp.]